MEKFPQQYLIPTKNVKVYHDFFFSSFLTCKWVISASLNSVSSLFIAHINRIHIHVYLSARKLILVCTTEIFALDETHDYSGVTSFVENKGKWSESGLQAHQGISFPIITNQHENIIDGPQCWLSGSSLDPHVPRLRFFFHCDYVNTLWSILSRIRSVIWLNQNDRKIILTSFEMNLFSTK